MKAKEINERNEQIALMLNNINNVIRFDDNWHWLMEALEFISDPDYGIYYKIGPNLCEIADNGKRGNVNLNAFKVLSRGTSSTSTKEAVFIAVSDFAKTFNSK